MKLIHHRAGGVRSKEPRPKPMRQMLVDALVVSFPEWLSKEELCDYMYGEVTPVRMRIINAFIYILRRDTYLEIETTNPRNKGGHGEVRLRRFTPELEDYRKALEDPAQRQSARMPDLSKPSDIQVKQDAKRARSTVPTHEERAQRDGVRVRQTTDAVHEQLPERTAPRRKRDKHSVRKLGKKAGPKSRDKGEAGYHLGRSIRSGIMTDWRAVAVPTNE